MSKKTTKRGNINAEFIYDPFLKSGLVKRYEPFIRKHVKKFRDSHHVSDKLCVKKEQGPYTFVQSSMRGGRRTKVSNRDEWGVGCKRPIDENECD